MLSVVEDYDFCVPVSIHEGYYLFDKMTEKRERKKLIESVYCSYFVTGNDDKGQR